MIILRTSLISSLVVLLAFLVGGIRTGGRESIPFFIGAAVCWGFAMGMAHLIRSVESIRRLEAKRKND